MNRKILSLGVAVALCGTVLGAVYTSESEVPWFAVDTSELEEGQIASGNGWTVPDDAIATVADDKIVIDADLAEPIVYTPTGTAPASTVTRIKANFAVDAVAAVPSESTFSSVQAVFSVVTNTTGQCLEWVALVYDSTTSANVWKHFTSPAPVVGTEYELLIELDARNSAKLVRYSIKTASAADYTVLKDGEVEWFTNARNESLSVANVAFAGSGTLGDFAGVDVRENVATFGGQNYISFEAALAAARAGTFDAEHPITLLKNTTYTPTADSETIYVNVGSCEFTIGGATHVTEQSGNAYTLTAKTACEATIDGTYYPTLEKALAAAAENATVIIAKAGVAKDALAIDKTITLDAAGNLTVAALTVAADKTLTLASGLAVTDATLVGSVAGETLTVGGVLSGVNVAKVAFAAGASFAYAETALAPTSLTIASTLALTGTLPDDTALVTADGISASMFTASLASGKSFYLDGNSLKVGANGAQIASVADTNVGCYNYTNKTISVTFENVVGSGSTATLVVRDAAGATVATYDKSVTGNGTVDFAVNTAEGLGAGAYYDYTVTVTTDGETGDAVAGTFATAAETSGWITENANNTGVDGTWSPSVSYTDGWLAFNGTYDFALTSAKRQAALGKLVSVDSVVTFATAFDVDDFEDDATSQGAIVAATNYNDGGAMTWYALTNGSWCALSGSVPELDTAYVIRAQFDYEQSPAKISYLVSPNGSDAYVRLRDSEGNAWFAIKPTVTTLNSIELQGTGSFAGFSGSYSDDALAQVGGNRYNSLADAFAAANGGTISLLANVTWLPNMVGSWTIAANGYGFIPYGVDGNLTIYENGSLRHAKHYVAQVGENDKYGFLDKALAAIGENGTLTLLTNVVDGVTTTLPAKYVTLDLAGCYVKWTADNVTIPSSGTLLVTNSTAFIGGVSASFLHGGDNTGSLVIRGGRWADNTTYTLDTNWQYFDIAPHAIIDGITYQYAAMFAPSDAPQPADVVVLPVAKETNALEKAVANAKVSKEWITKTAGISIDTAADRAKAAVTLNSKPADGNGYTYMQSYVLGLTPKGDNKTAPEVKQVQDNSTNSFTVSVGNVTVNQSAGVPVKFVVESSDTPSFTTTETAAQGKETSISVGLPTSGDQKVRYYRVKIEMGD